MSRQTIALAALAAMSAGAHASLVSFASDRDSSSFTFTGNGRQVTDAQDQFDPLLLLVDDDNGPLPTLAFATEFEADFLFNNYQAVPVGGGLLHIYDIAGTFRFLDVNTGGLLMAATFENATLTVLGTQGRWESTATIQVGDNAPGAQITYTWLGENLPGYGLFTESESVGLDDAAFTLTFLQSSVGFGVPLDPQGFPLQQWFSEGSFSGSAHFVPTPGAIALLTLAGLASNRRRR